MPDADIALCPHTPSTHCRCRKPSSLMVDRLRRRAGTNVKRTLMVGNALTDVVTAWHADVAFFGAARFFRRSAREAIEFIDIATHIP
jgi:histidinol phosphatase-like enzyme